MFKKSKAKFICIKIVVIAVWIIAWQIFAAIINNSLVLPSPIEVIVALFGLVKQASFWKSVWNSFSHITFGFLLAAITAILLSTLSYKLKFAEEFLSPPMTVLKTVPVASFIILMLISLKTKENLSTIICFMMSLPIIYTNLLAGLNSIDKKMLEMAQVFRISRAKRLTYLYAYKALPFFVTGCKVALGLCWKSAVAAELIGQVENTIGNELYYSKLYLIMNSVFAWTIVIVALSMLFELLVLGALRLLKRGLEK